jgi:hypothetical protein
LTSFLGAPPPNRLSQKPGSLFFVDDFDGPAFDSETNILDGFSASLVFAHPRCADWFIVESVLGCFFLIRGCSFDHGIDGHFHCTGTSQLGTESPSPTLGVSAKHDDAEPMRQKTATDRQIFETFMKGFHFETNTGCVVVIADQKAWCPDQKFRISVRFPTHVARERAS